MDRREFQLIEGTAKKFWAIKLDGKSFAVHYGRIGTAGQAQEKTFPTEDAAKAEYNKLITEKTKKGYAEVAAGATGATATPAPIVKAPAAPKAPAAEKPAPVAEPAAAVEAEPAAAVPAPVAAAPVAHKIERIVRLKDDDWNRVTWRRSKPVKKLVERPLDLDALREHLKKSATSWGQIYFHNIEIPEGPSKEEAWIWINLITAKRGGFKVDEADKQIDEIRASQVAAPEELRELRKFLAKSEHGGYVVFSHAPHLLLPFFTPLQITSMLITNTAALAAAHSNTYQRVFLAFHSIRAFSRRILPVMTEPERAEFRAMVEKVYDDERDPTSAMSIFLISLLATIGGGDRLTTHVARQANGTWTNRWNSEGNLDVLAGLGDEATFVAEARRLLGKLGTPAEVRLWLAATEWRELDMVVGGIKAAGSKDDASNLARLLALVEAPETAVPMLEVQLESKSPAIAAEWLADHIPYAIVGLTPAAMGQGKIAEAARDHLHTLRRSGRSADLRAAMANLTPAQAAWLEREIISVVEETLPELSRAELSAPLRDALAAVKSAKPPGWLTLSSLPPIKIAGKRLAASEIEKIVAALKVAPMGAGEAPLFALLKKEAERNSLDTFAWQLFEQWNNMGAPSKDKWAMAALSHLGGDACVLKLTPLVRAWPGESQHKRAVYGLDCLRAIGTDTALMALNGIAQKLKFKALKEKAQALMEEIASSRGLSREQLADRIVPDCGLDANGSRIFDFGPRQFKFVLGQEMKPLVRDAAGKVRPDLPAPNSADDAAKAEAAVAEWKLLKKTLREVLKVQAERLEDAMITGRRWTPEEFDQLLLKHPLMINLVRQLVFAAYAADGKIMQTFRGTEDQSLADQNDEETKLPANGQIGVVHPAHLDDAAKSAWGQILSDYEIIPPFQQLGRPICRPETEDLELTEITRFRGPKIPGIIVYGMLERSHWLRDTPADGGGFMQHSKHFPSANLTAFIKYTGMGIGYYEEKQEIEEVYFVPGHIKPEMWGDHKKRVKIKEVDPVIISEVLRLANAIVSKAG